MQMGMGAGFGMMMPGMMNAAMHGYPQAGGGHGFPPPPAPGGPAPGGPAPAGGPAGGPAGAMAAGTAAAGLSFDDLEGAAPQAANISAQDVIRGAAQSNNWQITENGDEWIVNIPVRALRKQNVHVTFGTKDDDGNELVVYHSYCGPASQRNAMALLRYNTKMIRGAFAVEPSDSGEMITVRANQLADTVDQLEVTKTLTAIAWQADKVEEKLLGSDNH